MNINFIFAAILATIISGGLGYYSGHSNGEKSVQQAWDKERAEIAVKLANAESQARENEIKLQAAADKLRKAKNDEIKNIGIRAASIADSLRDRPTRDAASTMPDNSGNRPCACTGENILREDAEFLVGIARQADEMTAAYKQCFEQYEKIRQGQK